VDTFKWPLGHYPFLLNPAVGDDITDNDVQTPLTAAASNGHLDVTEIFRGIVVLCILREGDWTALLAAADSGHVEFSSEFLKQLACVAMQLKNI
jgi:ankyrin repeat protein